MKIVETSPKQGQLVNVEFDMGAKLGRAARNSTTRVMTTQRGVAVTSAGE